jgi:hypothetical protein
MNNSAHGYTVRQMLGKEMSLHEGTDKQIEAGRSREKNAVPQEECGNRDEQ